MHWHTAAWILVKISGAVSKTSFLNIFAFQLSDRHVALSYVYVFENQYIEDWVILSWGPQRREILITPITRRTFDSIIVLSGFIPLLLYLVFMLFLKIYINFYVFTSCWLKYDDLKVLDDSPHETTLYIPATSSKGLLSPIFYFFVIVYAWKLSRNRTLSASATNSINQALNVNEVLDERYFEPIDQSDDACFFFPEFNDTVITLSGPCDESIRGVPNFDAAAVS